MKVKLRLNSPPLEELYGKMSVDVINMFAGFSGYYGGLTPYLKQILLVHYDDECTGWESINDEKCVTQIDFYRLFYSYPPYEPIPYPPVTYNDVNLYGNRIWLMEVNESVDSPISKKMIQFLIKKMRGIGVTSSPTGTRVFFGEYDEYQDEILLRKVITCRIVGDCPWFLRVEFRDEHNKIVHIYYGFRKLHKYLEEVGCKRPFKITKDKLQEAIELASRKLGRKSRYRVEYLNYMTWCYAGRLISTDPIAPLTECEYCKNRYNAGTVAGPCYDAPGGRIYYHSRKIFPKVIAEVSNDLEFQPDMPAVPFSVNVFSGKKLTSKVERLTMSLPKGRSLSLTPTKKPFTVLRRTNGLVVTVSEHLIRSLIHFMENYVVYSSKKLNKKYTLLHVLVSKYFVWKANPFKLSSVARIRFKDNKLHVDLTGLEKNFGNIADYVRNKRYLGDSKFLRFVGESLMHTLAHALLLILSEELNLSLDDLTYVYGSKTISVKTNSGNDEFVDVFYAAITEKNEVGTLQIDVELDKILGSDERGRVTALGMMLKEFWRNTKEALEGYWGEFSKISNEIAESVGRDEKASVITYVAKEILYGLLSREFLTDSEMLKQIIVNAVTDNLEAIRKYLKARLGEDLDVKEMEDLVERYVDDITTFLMDGIEPCFDGCNVDIRLDKQCSKALFENLYVSRNLLELFLKVAGIINYHRLEVDGEGLFKLVTAAKSDLHIRTAFTSTQALYALKDILRRGVKVTLEVDRRRIHAHINTLRKMARNFSNFKFKETDKPHHGKTLSIDLLDIVTSWNYGTSGYPLQDYKAVLRGLHED